MYLFSTSFPVYAAIQYTELDDSLIGAAYHYGRQCYEFCTGLTDKIGDPPEGLPSNVATFIATNQIFAAKERGYWQCDKRKH